MAELLESEWHTRITTVRLVLKRPLDPLATDGLTRVLDSLRAVESLDIRIEGERNLPAEATLSSLVEVCRRRGLRFGVGFVLDGDADASATLAGRPNSLSRIRETSRTLRSRGMSVCWWIPLIHPLVFRLEMIYSLALDEDVEPILLPAEALSTALGTEPRLDADERLFIWDFITYRLLEEERHRLTAACVDSYRTLQSTFHPDNPGESKGGETAAVLTRAKPGSEVEWHLGFECQPLGSPKANDGKPSSTPVGRLRDGVANAADVGGVLRDGFRGLAQWALSAAAAPFRRTGTPSAGREEKLPRVLLIGAYGGEHIGDAAILGGVLLRVHKRYGTTHAVLMSQRPAHSRHLVPMLDVPVAVDVRPYEHAHIRGGLEESDGVVYAGGPLTDLPKQLVRHLYTASLARRSGKPFVVEGIGAGPFVRRISEWTGRRIVKMASCLAVRTSDDGRQPLVADLELDVGRDPAFDYMESRPAVLTRVPEIDRAWIEELLQGTAGRPVIGLNLRPIRHLYTEGAAGQDPVEYTQSIVSRFEEQLAEGLRRFDQASPTKPCFVFYPMNAIQFGLSDLRSAYGIQRRLGNDVDLRIWEGDASVDGVVELLRRLDCVISMRFHATIFALAQGCRVIGIDYRIGKRDKVASLLSDFDQSVNCTRVDQLTAHWLFERLCVLSG